MLKPKTTSLVLVLSFIAVCILSYQTLTTTSWLTTAQNFGEVILKGKTAISEVKIKKPTQVYFTGDIMLGRNVERRLAGKEPDYPFTDLPFYKAKDVFVVGNFESSIPSIHVPTPNNTFRFSVASSSVTGLKTAGFTHLSLANNHAFDYGLAGYNNALSSFSDRDLIAFGHPSLISSTSVTNLNAEGYKISILAIHTLYGDPLTTELETTLSSMRDNSDLQVVYIHWGNEYENKPSQRQRLLAEKLIKLGADLIVGHHPHIIQSVEVIDSVPVFYSLGNLVFDQYFSPEVQHGLVLALDLERMTIKLLPTESVTDSIKPKLLSKELNDAALKSLADISMNSVREYILTGEVPLRLATSPEIVIMSR